MFRHSDSMRVMAERYLQLAETTEDANERSKFFDYAMVYAQLSEQAEQRETSETMAGEDRERSDVPERGDVSERGDDVIARPHG